MQISAERISQLWQSDPGAIITAFTMFLADFGYPVSPQYVKQVVTDLIAGKPPKGAPALFIDIWLKEGLE